MALYFNERGLRYENGKVFLISYYALLEECLKEPFETISISAIIFNAIANMTGKRVIKNKNYNKSQLFRWLEKRIAENPGYIQAKKIKLEQDRAYRKHKKEYQENMKNLRGFNENLDKIEKRRRSFKTCALNSGKEW